MAKIIARTNLRWMLVAAAVCLSFLAGIWAERAWLSPEKQALPPPAEAAVPVPAGSAQEISLIVQAWETIREKYVDRAEVSPRQLAYGAIDGMVKALGDTGHSRFLTPEMVVEKHVLLGEAQQAPSNRPLMKDHPAVEESPGRKVLPQENGLSLYAAQLSSWLNTPGNVTWKWLPGTNYVYLRIGVFSKDTAGEVRRALVAIRLNEASGIVLDLRDNPGGLVKEAVEVASQFLGTGVVVQEGYADGSVKALPVLPGGMATDLPVIVLVNQQTISSAEIVAAALQDAGRAKLVGARTFGTGTVLKEFPLQDASALLLATKKWMTPSGKLIRGSGLSPDILVEQPAGPNSGDPPLREAIRDLKKNTAPHPLQPLWQPQN